MKLVGGCPALSDQLNVDAFLEQARSYDKAASSPVGWYIRFITFNYIINGTIVGLDPQFSISYFWKHDSLSYNGGGVWLLEKWTKVAKTENNILFLLIQFKTKKQKLFHCHLMRTHCVYLWICSGMLKLGSYPTLCRFSEPGRSMNGQGARSTDHYYKEQSYEKMLRNFSDLLVKNSM